MKTVRKISASNRVAAARFGRPSSADHSDRPAGLSCLAGRLILVRLCATLLVAAFLAVSCASVPTVVSPGRASPSERIMGEGSIGRDRMVAFFMASNPSADRAKVARMAGFYIDEGKIEGVNPDVAFVQMCLETGFLRFGGLVTEDMNNFCGLGSIGPGQSGNRFPRRTHRRARPRPAPQGLCERRTPRRHPHRPPLQIRPTRKAKRQPSTASPVPGPPTPATAKNSTPCSNASIPESGFWGRN